MSASSRRILLVTPAKTNCGNYSTVSRIRSHLQKTGYETYLCDPSEFTTEGAVVIVEEENIRKAASNGTDNTVTLYNYLNFLQTRNIDLVIGIHAYKTGKLIKDCPIPYVIILGGTDVNEDYLISHKRTVMTEVLQKASGIVCLSTPLRNRMLTLWPDSVSEDKVYLIPQAATVAPSSFDLRNYLRNKEPSLRLTDDTRIFLFVGGIRQVKNPMYMLNEFSEWHRKKPELNIVLLFIGPKLDEEYFEIFLEKLNSQSGIYYIPGLSAEDTHACIKDSFALVNTSDSEGMAVSILEAMLLGTPVLVRGIPGNTEIVEDNKTGLVFHTAQEFVEKATELINNVELKQQITQNALKYVAKQHSMATEESQWSDVVSRVTAQI